MSAALSLGMSLIGGLVKVVSDYAYAENKQLLDQINKVLAQASAEIESLKIALETSDAEVYAAIAQARKRLGAP